MRYRLFQYALPAPPELDELNAFLGANRIAAVTHHLAATAGGAMLSFVVETPTGAAKSGGAPAARIDYRELLSTEEFAAFSRLRAERKRWACA